MQANEAERLPDEQIIGQMSYVLSLLLVQHVDNQPGCSFSASILLFAATDTTSHLMAQVLQLLCEHPDIQDKLRHEILASRNGQDIAYDQLNALPYLDAICKETLRLYVPVGACIHAVPLLMQCSRSASLQLQLSCASKCIHGKCIVQSDTFYFLQGVSRLDTTPC